MNKLLSAWEAACASSGALRFIDINLRGIGQVMFQDNPLTGALFLAAIGWGSYSADVPQVALGGAIAVVVATLTAQWLRADRAALHSGLYGYNAVLVRLDRISRERLAEAIVESWLVVAPAKAAAAYLARPD